MHGLTANAHAFDGLVANCLTTHFRVISPDLRGRGQSDHPAFQYSMEDHALDIIGLLDHLNIDKVTLAGHSFGGLLGFYIASSYPGRVDKLIIMDAAAEMNPNAMEMLSYTFSRFNTLYPSWDDYISHVKRAPYNTFWDDAMLSYYQADVKIDPDGTVKTRSNLTDIIEISYGVANISWPYYIERITQPTLLINALDDYTMGEPLLPEEKAMETVEMMKNAHYVAVDGNHQTMLYGRDAKQIVKAIDKFTSVAKS